MRLKYLIMCRSLTYAQRSAKALENAGITAVVSKAPQGITNAGCAYCVKVSERRLQDALRVMRASGLEITKVFEVAPSGEITEVKL
jgi:rhodanese-related sulfurtransferase